MPRPYPKPLPRKKRKGKSKSEYQVQEDYTWAVFSRCIRLRDTDENGNGTCIATGEKIWYRIVDGKVETNCDAGHFISRKVKSIMFAPQNVNAQSKASNYADINQKEAQRPRLIEKIGSLINLLLDSERLWKSGKIGKMSIDELKKRRTMYKKWEKELLLTKKFES